MKITMTKTLKDELDLEYLKFLDCTSEEVADIILDTMRKQVSSNISRFAIKKGDTAPDFVLPDVDGELIDSETLREKGPLVVIFYRGDWCPYCNVTLHAYQRCLQEIESKGATLIAISPQKHDDTIKTEEVALKFHGLSDSRNTVAKLYNLAYEIDGELRIALKQLDVDISIVNGTPGFHALPIPATYVIDPEGRVVYSCVESDFRKRPEPTEVIAAIPTR